MKLGQPFSYSAATIAWTVLNLAPVQGAVVPHTQVQSYLDTGNPGTPVHIGTNLVRNMHIRCPSGNPTCTLALSATEQVCSEAGGGQAYQIMVTVDSVQVDSGEWFEAVNIPCSGGSWSDIQVVNQGIHTIKLYVVVPPDKPDPITQGRWSVNYAVTVP